MTEDEIRVLHVDDDSELAELVATFLERTDDRFTVHSETSPSDGFDYLLGNSIDCVISDHDMPGTTGIEFLEEVREQYPDLPFVLYTGKGSEEVASEAISAGVTDYLQKDSGTDHYAVLANRVGNAVDQARSRRAAERTKRRLSAIVENITDAIVIIDETSTVRFANPAVENVFGYPSDELIGGPLTKLMPDRFRGAHEAAVERYLRTGERTMDWQSVELTGKRRDGRELPISVTFSEFEQDGEPRFIGVITETTDGQTDG